MRSCLVLGSGRSGTSMVAGTLARSGAFLGGELWPAREANPKGFFEGPAVNGINEEILARVLPPETDLVAGQRWLAELPRGVEVPLATDLLPRIAGLTGGQTWCFKDPRFCYTLPAWGSALDDAARICVFRHPAATAASVVEECRTAPYLAGLAVDLARALRIWTCMYARVLDSRRRGGDWLFLHYDQVLSAEGLDRIAALTGAAVDRSFPDRRLRRDPPMAELPGETTGLYAELCALAEYDRPVAVTRASGTPDVTVVVPVDDGEEHLVARAVEELRAQRGARTEVVVVDRTTAGGLDPQGATVVRERSPAIGAALRAALPVARGRAVALHEVGCTSLPHRLAHQVEILDQHAGIDLVTTDLALRREGTGFVGSARVGEGELPPFWEAGLTLRREAAASVSAATFWPTLAEAITAARARNQAWNVSEPLVSVESARFEAARPSAEQDARLAVLGAQRYSGPPLLTVSLCTFNRRRQLAECLSSFCRQELPPGLFEIVLVDDGSTDGTPEWLDAVEFPVPVTRIRQENRGLAAARNAGLAAARGRIVLFVNDDTIALPDLVLRHLETHAEGEDIAVLGTFEQPPAALATALTRHLERSDLVFDQGTLTPGATYDGFKFYTCNVSVGLDSVRAAGGFDESFRAYGCEDTDLGVRLERLGIRVRYVPAARALHLHELDLDALARRQRTVARAFVRFFRKHPDLLARWPGAGETTARTCRSEIRRLSLSVPDLLATARSLGGLDLASIESMGGDWPDVASRLTSDLGALLGELNGYWWHQGYLDGFEEHGMSGFPDIAAAA